MTKGWRSGAAWVAQMIVQAIAEQGATIAFVAPLAQNADREPAHANVTRVVTPREIITGGGKFSRARASLSRVAAGLAAVCRLRFTTRTFIFSIPEPLIFTLPLFMLLRLSGAQVVLIVHDAQPHAWAFGPRFRMVEKGAHRLSYRLASKLVALTQPVKKALHRDFGIAPEKIVVIPHGPFVVGEKTPLPGNNRLLLFGSLRRNKNVLPVIEGIKLARKSGKDVSLVLAGAPLKEESGYWEQCENAVAEDPDGFEMRVGFIEDEQVPALIAGVDAFVLAYDNFDSQSGVGVLAALAGRPVIATRSGGLDELFDRGMSGEFIASPVTPQTIAAAVVAFLSTSSDVWQARASDGAEQVAKSLRWDDIADQYIALARREVQESSATAPAN